MALNNRQTMFINRVQEIADLGVKLAQLVPEAVQQFAEEFDNEQDNSLLNSDSDVEAAYGFNAADVKAAMNQFCGQFANFWNGSAVTTREYGKDCRRVSRPS